MAALSRQALISTALSLIVIAGALGYWWYDRSQDSFEYAGGYYDPPKPAPALTLTDQSGQPFDLQSLQGKVVLIYFGYTHCPDFCPTTMIELQAVKEQLGTQAANVAVVMVSVDPERDTPERLAEYLGFFDPTFIGLTGTVEAVTTVKRDWGILATREESDSAGGYLVSHNTSVYAIDAEGNLALTWAYGTAPEDIAADVDHLLDA